MPPGLTRAIRRFIPKPLRLGLALARRRMADRLADRTRLLVRPPHGPGLDGAAVDAVTVRQTINRSQFWEGKLHNLALAARIMDGVVIPPGGIFSFWALVGRPSVAAGFREGRSIRSDAVGSDVGGGLCQISGIAYEIGLRAGLAVVERHPHSRDLYTEDQRFTPLGLDATVVWPNKDLRLRNGLSCPVRFRFTIVEMAIEASIQAPHTVAAATLSIERVDGASRRHVRVIRLMPDHTEQVISVDDYAT